jgi:curved DNA-binding protein CbpA
MDVSKDYYATLGVLPTAEDYIIQAAYKALCKRFHPDVYKGSDAHDKMAAINEAYEVLGDASKRSEYDRAREQGTSDESDFFNEDFDADSQGVDPVEEEAWKMANSYFPELDASFRHLTKTSSRLAFSFRAYLIESKKFDKHRQIAKQMETDFLTQFFGTTKKLHEFAKEFINQGRKDILLELNRVVKVLGDSAPNEIIRRLEGKFNLPTRKVRNVQKINLTRPAFLFLIGVIMVLAGIVGGGFIAMIVSLIHVIINMVWKWWHRD